MLHTLIGEEAFQRGMRLYFERHDGQAVTCEDFVAAMEAASGRDLAHFRRWYSQAGTPVLTARGEYDPAGRRYALSVHQGTPPTPGQPEKAPLHIPLALGLLGRDGHPLPLRLQGTATTGGTSRVIELGEAQGRIVFEDVDAAPVPSLLRGFSAPVKLDAPWGDAELRLLMACDEDPFVRWEAGQTYAVKLLLGMIEAVRQGRPVELESGLAEAYDVILAGPLDDPAFVAEALTLPSEGYLGEQLSEIDPDAIHAAREAARAQLGRALRERFLRLYEVLGTEGPYQVDARSMGRRALRNLALAYLVAAGDEDGQALCTAQFERADNMTDRLAALGLLVQTDLPSRATALADFYRRWQGDPLVVDKWFSLQASAQLPDALATVQRLVRHPAFKLTNPNRARALLGAFAAGNPTGFHRSDGAGYVFIADRLLELDRLNPQVTARMLSAFSRWRRYDEARQGLMRAQLERLLAAPGISRDVYEIASKSLK